MSRTKEEVRKRQLRAKAFDLAKVDEDKCRLSFSQSSLFDHPSDDVMVAYYRMRYHGESHNMAEMLATRSFPGVHGLSSTFMQGTHIQDTPLDAYRHQAAKEQGVDTNGRRYISGLARYPNDPEAWVSDLSDVTRICAARGWNVHGAVEYEAPKDTAVPSPDIPVGEDIVRSRLAAELAPYDDGDISPRLIADKREALTKELSGQVDTKPELKVSDYEYHDAEAICDSPD